MTETKKSRTSAATASGKTAGKKTADATATAPRKPRADRTPLTVEPLMTRAPQVCRVGDDLAAAAAAMWTADCGCLPVLDDDARLVGWITDRDISMALGMQRARATEIEVGQVMNGPVHACRHTDTVKDALARMTERQVRRIAVLDESDALVGVLSVADLVQVARPRATASAPSVSEVFQALRGIGRPYADPAGDGPAA